MKCDDAYSEMIMNIYNTLQYNTTLIIYENHEAQIALYIFHLYIITYINNYVPKTDVYV